MPKLSERDVCSKFITPALVSAGWDLQTQIREEISFTKGRIIVRGKLHSQGKGSRAGYVLYYRANQPIALIEAKDQTYSLSAGTLQGLDYAETLDLSPLAVQHQIVTKVDQLIALCNRLKAVLATARWRQATPAETLIESGLEVA